MTTRITAIAIALVSVVLGQSWHGSAFGEGWQAGTARAVITPNEPMWMAGYAARDHESEGKIHDLWVKALALRDPAGKKAVLITLDLCGIGRELSLAIRDRIQQAGGLDRSQVVLCCSHTHSGPVVGRNLLGMYPLDEPGRAKVLSYVSFLEDKVIEVAAEALSHLAPASVSWSIGRCDFAVNRRNNDQSKVEALRATLSIQGPVDHDVPVIRIERPGGTLAAVVALYACHCTTLSGYRFSGDYAGFAQLALERSYPGVQAMFVAGCGGDQNPLPRGTVQQAEAYGGQLAAAVDRTLSAAMVKLSGPLETAYREIDLEFSPIPPRSTWEEESKAANLAAANRAKAMLAILDAGESVPSVYPYPVQLWNLGGELRWVFLGGEVTVDYALRLKTSMGSSRTFVAAYCNDVMAYIPSLRVLREGGYEGGGAMVYYGLPAAWSDRVEEQVIGAVRELSTPADSAR